MSAFNSGKLFELLAVIPFLAQLPQMPRDIAAGFGSAEVGLKNASRRVSQQLLDSAAHCFSP
jgi:hypothetical protein